MASVNKVILIGNVGADPEARTTQSGKAVAELRMATTEKYGDTETTEWHRVIFWEKLAEVVTAYVKKGTPIYVEGRIQTRSYDDAEGVKRYITEIVAREMRMLGGKRAEAEEPAPEPKKRGRKAKAEAPAPAADDDLPF